MNKICVGQLAPPAAELLSPRLMKNNTGYSKHTHAELTFRWEF